LHSVRSWTGNSQYARLAQIAAPILLIGRSRAPHPKRRTVRDDAPRSCRVDWLGSPVPTRYILGRDMPIAEESRCIRGHQPRALHRQFVGPCRRVQANRGAVEWSENGCGRFGRGTSLVAVSPASARRSRSRYRRCTRPRNRPRPRGLAQDVASELLAHGAGGWRRKLAAGVIQ